jgi:hypothetical protein
LNSGADLLQHLLHLFPPHSAEPPSTPSPYLYLAQTAEDPHEALGYYSTGASMIERKLGGELGKGKGRQVEEGTGEEDESQEERAMGVRCLVAMIEIWMSDLWCVNLFHDSDKPLCHFRQSRSFGYS